MSPPRRPTTALALLHDPSARDHVLRDVHVRRLGELMRPLGRDVRIVSVGAGDEPDLVASPTAAARVAPSL